jgi:anti-sigma B factor antagonist
VPLQAKVRRVGEIVVVDLSGRIVFGEECDLLRQEVKKAIQDAPGVVLNLRDVQYVDSGGIGCIVGLFTTATASGRELRLAGGNEKVQHVLKITKLAPVLGVFADEHAALATFRKKATA